MANADNIYLIRAAQAQPFVETAKRMGAPVTQLARKANLPLADVAKGRGAIGEHCLWEFVGLTGQLPGFGIYGYQVALDHPVTNTHQLGGMSIKQDGPLNSILKSFVRDLTRESNGADHLLARRQGSHWYVRKPFLPGHFASWHAEMYVIAFVIQIVRLCAPGDWLPSTLQVYAKTDVDPVPAEWSGLKIGRGKDTAIELSEDVLNLPPRFAHSSRQAELPAGSGEAALLHFNDLIDRQIWSQNTGFEAAAIELGLSGSTLKRRLKASGSGYGKLLLDRRMHHARRLLVESELQVSDIARALGYTSTSNFSRAFSKEQGCSPSTFRFRKEL